MFSCISCILLFEGVTLWTDTKMKFSGVFEKSEHPVLAQEPSGCRDTNWAYWRSKRQQWMRSRVQRLEELRELRAGMTRTAGGSREQQGVSGEHGDPGTVPLPGQAAVDGGAGWIRWWVERGTSAGKVSCCRGGASRRRSSWMDGSRLHASRPKG